MLGIPTYGRSYTLVNPDAHEIGSPTDGPGKKGDGTKEDGYLAYYEVLILEYALVIVFVSFLLTEFIYSNLNHPLLDMSRYSERQLES